MPPGIDIIYNTNKAAGTDPKKVFKPMKTNADGSLNNDNPFGASIKPGGQRGALNIIQEEGDWNSWSKTLSTQMLSKQKPSLAKQQLNLTYAERMDEFDSIIKLTNNTVKKHFLSSFADSCDADAVHLDAAGLPRQAWKVILPVPSLKDNEVYAPTFKNGEQVVLIRHPHGGIFEIPELRVNNKNAAAKSVLGNAKDAVAINSKVAEVLSGADFDGDTVLVIPNNSRSVKTSAPLQGLKDFDPRAMYAYSDSDIASGAASIMTNAIKQQQMGNVSNLITDMTIKGASNDEIARAVRHSMVVIDAEKHKYDYKQSAIDNGIAQLKKEYQGGANRGASTLISRASSEMYVDARKDQVRIDPKTGQQLFQPKGETYEQVKKVKNQDGTTTYVPTGKMLTRKTKSTKMAEVKDAYELSSGTTIENYYADYANKMKALANQTRKELVATPNLKYDPTAKKVYAAEVESLNAKLNLALMNAPLERQAILIADTTIRATRQANPDMDKDEIKKLKSQALQGARQRTGADKKSRLIDITDKEWEAIQNGAITHTTLTSILQNANDEAIRARAMPKPANALSSTQRSRIKAMLATGYTQAEIAAQLGISVSTINNMD
jgi:hypothetical protein